MRLYGNPLGQAWGYSDYTCFQWQTLLSSPDPIPPFRLEDPAAAAQALTPSLFDDGDTFFGPTVTATKALTPSLYSDADTFFAPTVTPGAVSLTPSLFSDGDTISAATITATYALVSSLFADGDTFHSPTVAADGVEQELTAALFVDDDTFYSAVVTATPLVVIETDFHGRARVKKRREKREEDERKKIAALVKAHDAPKLPASLTGLVEPTIAERDEDEEVLMLLLAS